MSILDQLLADIKDAMKVRDSEKLLALRTLHADIKKIAIDAGRRDPSEDDVLTALRRAIKQREEAADQFRSAGRADLLAQEESQAAWYRAYLPCALTEDELRALVLEAIAEVGTPVAMGPVMKVAVAKVAGRADGRRLQEAVKAALS